LYTGEVVCKRKACCGRRNLAFLPDPDLPERFAHLDLDDCHVAGQKYCGGAKKCCTKLLFGIDTNDYKLASNVAAMRSAGVNFVVRYVSNYYDPILLGLNATEASKYRAAKMPMAAVWETTRLRAIEGGSEAANFANGAADAAAAQAVMTSIGASTKPVYYAVDVFVNPPNYDALDANVRIRTLEEVFPYFRGIISVVGLSRSGAYGPYTLIKGLFDNKLIKYGWQASSFDSGTRLDPRAQLYQCNTWPPDTFGSDQVDYNFALRKNFGQFK